MSEKLELLHTDRVLIVEGKYDAARLSHLTDAMILLTDGFGIYKDKKRQQLFKQLAHKNGLILLTDSDAAGFRIRTYITNLVGEKNVVQAYVPAIHGKEKRKAQPGKEGLLGVEGVDDALVLQALRDALGEEAGIAPAKPEDVRIIHSPVGMPGRALNTPLVQALAKGKRFAPRHCARCLKTCDPAKVPYCITHALIEAVKGNVEEGLFFCGANVGRLDRMYTVRELMDELTAEWRHDL